MTAQQAYNGMREFMKISVDENLCCGYAACLSLAPELFSMGDDNIAIVLDPEPGPGSQSAANDAAAACPTGAIQVNE